MFCQSCGQVLGKMATDCPNCGLTVVGSPTTDASSNQEYNRWVSDRSPSGILHKGEKSLILRRGILVGVLTIVAVIAIMLISREVSDRHGMFSSGPSSSAGANSGKLTNEKAQRAVDNWVNNRGQITVSGIQEIPTENTAKADLRFSNFRFKGGLGEENHSGPGVAIFSHYNDGRWVLKKIQWETKVDYYTASTDIEVQ
jgi:hypothetical protein